MKFEVELSDEEIKALETDMMSVQDWLNNAIHNKARQCIDAIAQAYSDKQPKKITEQEKLEIVRHAKVKSAAERQAEIDRRLPEP